MEQNGIFTKLNSIISQLSKKLEGFFNHIIFESPDDISNKDEQTYWKNKVLYIVSVSLIIFGAPLLFYGAYMFYTEGYTMIAISEAFTYFVLAFVLKRKVISPLIRKIILVFTLYAISIVLLVTTGLMGGGMVCVCITLILAGCLFDKKQLNIIVGLNVIIFLIITVLLMLGYLDQTMMYEYKRVWFINATVAQVGGIILLKLMQTIFEGLESQVMERKLKEEKILHISYHDSLTGLYNRMYYDMELERLSSKSSLPLSIIIGDINGLKLINDTLGHAEGDKLIITMGEILKSCCRREDIIARLGGDEFNILLPNTSAATANHIIEKIYDSCNKYNKKLTNELYRISISLGTVTKSKQNDKMDNLLKIAEDNMYRRKLLDSRSLHSTIITSMKTVLFEKSQETEEHAQRMVKLSKVIGQVIGLSSQQFDELELFATLHDIGKIGIDDQILNKPGKLTEEEWVIMKKHSEIGFRIAMSSPELVPIAYYIYTHHERWDGKGYPQGLEEDNIPLLSRILAVADTYDAMTEDRVYRKGLSKKEAINEISRCSGTQFDPDIVKIFVSIVDGLDLENAV